MSKWLILPVVLIILGIATLIVIVRNVPEIFFRDLTASFKRTGWQLNAEKDTTKRTARQGGGATTPSATPKLAPKPITIFHAVRIASARETTFPIRFKTIVLRGDADAAIDITGWKIQSNHDTFIIPKAVAYFSPNRISEPSDRVVLARGVELSLYSHTGVTSHGFRMNKCMGYITRTTNFIPSLSASCPSLNVRNISSLTSRCQDYILRLGSCALPETNPPVSPTDLECFDVFKTVNYNGCADRHNNDKDYIQNQWHIWLGNGGNRELFDPLHDRIRLYDTQGTLVDEYIY